MNFLSLIVSPLDKLSTMDRLALLSLIPRLVTDGSYGRVCCQSFALSVIVISVSMESFVLWLNKNLSKLTDTH